MSKNVLILFPRLDVPFKDLGPISKERGPIPPIRVHWINALNAIVAEHQRRGDNVVVVERPLWHFDPAHHNKDYSHTDIIYVPHREKHSYDLGNKDVRYYMQSVFPWRFYIDSKGFAGGASFYPLDISDDNPIEFDHRPFDSLRFYVGSGYSKFEQPQGKIWSGPGEYVLFTCQIPHDITIRDHSNVTVEQALEETCRATKKLGMTLVVKGHPINRASMDPLKSIAAKYTNTLWVDDYNIHDVISKARVVVTVNSGTGMEALLHLKPVVTFGRCEYDVCTMNADLGGNIESYLQYPWIGETIVERFFDKWTQLTYDTKNPNDFLKLP